MIYNRDFYMSPDKKMRVVHDAPTVRNLDTRVKHLLRNQCAPRRLNPEAHRRIIMCLAAMTALPFDAEQPIPLNENPIR